MTHPFIIRSYTPADLPGMAELFRAAVHTTARGDYTREQLEAWAPASIDPVRWRERFGRQEVVVAEVAGELAGFCSWAATGYLDFLYVHHARQRQGIATALYTAAEKSLRAKGLNRIHTQASLTARPFFESQGFRLVKRQTVHVRGVDLPNAVMGKRLP